MAATNQNPTSILLTHEIGPAHEHVATALGATANAPVIHLLRLRYAGNRPLAIMENYLPAELVDLRAADLATTGLYRTMRDAGVVPKTARQRIGARAGTDEECLLLDEPPNSPMLTMDRVTQDGDGRVVEYASHLFRASRYEYAATLVGRP